MEFPLKLHKIKSGCLGQCLTQLSMKFIMLISVIMPTVVAWFIQANISKIQGLSRTSQEYPSFQGLKFMDNPDLSVKILL